MADGDKRSTREALLYTRIRGDKVRCDLCHRRCIIPAGERGHCGTRENVDGTLYNLFYGKLSCLESRPIEIKPFFHYWPASTAMTFSTWSCNFDCPWCQNHHISKRLPHDVGETVPPEHVLAAARAKGDQGLCASFQEPTIGAEYALDLFKLGRKHRMYSCFVSNGYMTEKALRLLAESGMDGMNVDLKGPPDVYENFCGDVAVTHVLQNARMAKRLGIHVEVVNLVVTGVNDDDSSIKWVVDRHLEYLGKDVPLHFTRYHPAYRFTEPATRIEILEDAVKIAAREGVMFPYVGNVHGHRYENTYCPECGSLTVLRAGYRVIRFRLDHEYRCKGCGHSLPFFGKPPSGLT